MPIPTDSGEMTATRIVVACVECKTHWQKGAESAQCSDLNHQHLEFEVHRHRSEVVLPGGAKVFAVSFDVAEPYRREMQPDFGLYFDRRWQPPWPHDHLDWPDFGVPSDTPKVVDALKALLNRACSGERVEIGCIGGHGRTGTALGCLAIMCGHPPSEAVAWVKANYCQEAVETPDQERFVTSFATTP